MSEPGYIEDLERHGIFDTSEDINVLRNSQRTPEELLQRMISSLMSDKEHDKIQIDTLNATISDLQRGIEKKTTLIAMYQLALHKLKGNRP